MALSATDVMIAVYSLLGLTLLNVFQRTMELENGILETKDHEHRTRGIYLPLNDYELIKEGAPYQNLSLLVHIQQNLNITCQQSLLETLQTALCIQHIMQNHKNSIRYTLGCTDNVASVRNCGCVTFDNDSCSLLIGVCPYGCGNSGNSGNWVWNRQVYHSLPSNLSKYNYEMCGRLNRDGPLCSKCMKNFSPLVYSYDLKCVPCKHSHYNWLKFVAIAFIPLTLFYFMMLLFRIDATSPYLYGFITLNQALASPISLRGYFFIP